MSYTYSSLVTIAMIRIDMTTNSDAKTNPSRFEVILFLGAMVPGVLMFWFFDLPEALGSNPAYTTQRVALFSVVVITLTIAIIDFLGTKHHPSLRSVMRIITAVVYGIDIGGGFVFAVTILQSLGL